MTGQYMSQDQDIDQAMSAAQQSSDLGGIDLNPANTRLHIQRDPGQMEMPLQFDLCQLPVDT